MILMGISSQVTGSPRFGEVNITDWKTAGLIGPSVAKAVIATIEKRLVIRKLGAFSDADCDAVEQALRLILAK